MCNYVHSLCEHVKLVGICCFVWAFHTNAKCSHAQQMTIPIAYGCHAKPRIMPILAEYASRLHPYTTCSDVHSIPHPFRSCLHQYLI